MSYKGPQKVQKVMVQPINLIFRYLQNRSRVQVWLFENINLRIEGHIVGFDEYMNLVLDDAEEYHTKTKNRKQLGRIMLKGDNITLIQNTNPTANWNRPWILTSNFGNWSQTVERHFSSFYIQFSDLTSTIASNCESTDQSKHLKLSTEFFTFASLEKTLKKLR